MKDPTIEQIEKIIRNSSEELAAQDIYDRIHPTFKPLSELHLDREACEKIFTKVTQGQISKVSLLDGGTLIQGFRTREDGLKWQSDVTIRNGCVYLDGYNATDFKLVRFIESLGYSA